STDQRYERDRTEVLLVVVGAIRRAAHANQVLSQLRYATRDHQSAARRELVEERRRDLGRCAGGHDDRVVRRVLLPAECAVTNRYMDVVVSERPQALPCLPGEEGVSLDRVDLVRNATEDRKSGEEHTSEL